MVQVNFIVKIENLNIKQLKNLVNQNLDGLNFTDISSEDFKQQNAVLELNFVKSIKEDIKDIKIIGKHFVIKV